MSEFKVPQELKQYIAKAKDEKAKKVARVEKYEKLEKERLARIEELRQKNRDDLIVFAEEIVSWTKAFLDTPEARELAQILGRGKRLPLFFGRFWRGEPIPETVITEKARLSFELWTEKNLFILRYEELHKGQVSEEIAIYSATELVNKAHPEFLRQACLDLRKGLVWDHLLMELKRFQ